MGARAKPKREYTDAERAEALAALASNGGNISRTAAQLKIPRMTLSTWAGKGDDVSDELAALKERAQGNLASALEGVAWRLVGVMPEKLEAASLRDVATALGITVDKIQLLRGEPTAITEEVSTARDTLDFKLSQLAARRGAESVPGKPH